MDQVARLKLFGLPLLAFINKFKPFSSKEAALSVLQGGLKSLHSEHHLDHGMAGWSVGAGASQRLHPGINVQRSRHLPKQYR